MIRVDYDKNITVSKGDVAKLKIKFSNNINGYKCYFTVKKNISDQSPVFSNTYTIINDSVDIDLSHSDTNRTKGIYYYDMRIVDRTSSPSKIITPFEPKKFIIIDTVKEIS